MMDVDLQVETSSSPSNDDFSFERASLSSVLGENTLLSPGTIHGNRLALGNPSKDQIFFCSKNSIFRVYLSKTALKETSAQYSDGKYLLPAPVDRMCTIKPILSSTGAIKHCSEIQNLDFASNSTNGPSTLYSSDSMGNVILTSLHEDDSITNTQCESSKYASSEYNWVGISCDAKSSGNFVTARYTDKLLSLYDQGRIVREIKTLNNPYQVKMMENGLVAVTEAGFYSIWDLRIAENKTKISVSGSGAGGSCVQRIHVSSMPLYGMDIMDTKILVGGAERVVCLFDVRNDGAEAKWNNALKYEITRVFFSRKDPKLCYVSGLDNEILIGSFNGSHALSHFDGPRIESNWAGMMIDKENDDMYGLSQSGHIYISKNIKKLLDTVASQKKRPITTGEKEKTANNQSKQQQKQQDNNITSPPKKKMKVNE